jgi:hypothetical protein
MQTTSQNPTKVATKWALIYVITGIIITYAIQLLALDPNSAVKYLSYLPFIGFLLLAQKEFKDKSDGYITFGQGFSVGFRYGVFSGLFFAVFLYLYLAILSPDMLTKSLDTQREAMAAKGLSAEQIDKGMDIAKKYGAIFAAFGVAIWFAILGAIIGLIGAAIFKKERTAFDPEPIVADDTTV